jgi:hypothetical protein
MKKKTPQFNKTTLDYLKRHIRETSRSEKEYQFRVQELARRLNNGKK